MYDKYKYKLNIIINVLCISNGLVSGLVYKMAAFEYRSVLSKLSHISIGFEGASLALTSAFYNAPVDTPILLEKYCV